MSTGTDNGVPIPQKVLDLFGDRLLVGYMATARPDGHLSVVPVGVMIQDGKLRISSRTGTRKIENLRRNPHISVCVTDPNDLQVYATIRGTAELADDVGREFVTWLARTHMGVDEYPYEPNDTPRTVITIRPEKFMMPKVHGLAE